MNEDTWETRGGGNKKRLSEDEGRVKGGLLRGAGDTAQREGSGRAAVQGRKWTMGGRDEHNERRDEGAAAGKQTKGSSVGCGVGMRTTWRALW